MKVTLVRHTSLAIAPNICYGQSDVDVSHQFEAEHARIAEKLSADSFDAVYASPLQRCHKLALKIAKHQPVNLDTRLKELHFGDWEMQAWEDLPREVFDDWAQNYAHRSPPNGETFAALQERGVDFLRLKASEHINQHILVITHGGMIRALIAHVLNMELKGLFRIGIDYGSLTQLDFSHTIPKVNFINR
jgi:alpha-ribazole phosphatase